MCSGRLDRINSKVNMNREQAAASKRLLGAIMAMGKGAIVLIVSCCDCIGVEGGIWPRLSIGNKPETSVCSKYIK
jgi:hypothetical protein